MGGLFWEFLFDCLWMYVSVCLGFWLFWFACGVADLVSAMITDLVTL